MTKPASRAAAGAGAGAAKAHSATQKASRRSTARPIVCGQRYYVQWRTGEAHVAEIVESRPFKRAAVDAKDGRPAGGAGAGAGAEALEYYVHYISFDRRLDEWVTVDRVDAVAPVVVVTGDGLDLGGEEGGAGGRGAGTQRRSKKKVTVAGGDAPEAKEGAGSLEKEHEEITKVKNIQYIELGKYEIETWYFAPYPGNDRCLMMLCGMM
jgi:histone acetyltransferase MYST1